MTNYAQRGPLNSRRLTAPKPRAVARLEELPEGQLKLLVAVAAARRIEGRTPTIAELRALGISPDSTGFTAAAKERAYRSTAPNSVAINFVLDVAIYKAKRGDDLATVVAELEAIS